MVSWLWCSTRVLYIGRNASYPKTVIRSFADKPTAALFAGHRVRNLPPDIRRRAYVKLHVLERPIPWTFSE